LTECNQAQTSVVRCPLAVDLEILARAASSLAVNGCLPKQSREHGRARGAAGPRRHLDHICGYDHLPPYRGTLSFGKQRQFDVGRTIREARCGRVAV